jgi:hypothetical protein
LFRSKVICWTAWLANTNSRPAFPSASWTGASVPREEVFFAPREAAKVKSTPVKPLNANGRLAGIEVSRFTVENGLELYDV